MDGHVSVMRADYFEGLGEYSIPMVALFNSKMISADEVTEWLKEGKGSLYNKNILIMTLKQHLSVFEGVEVE